MSYPMTQRLTVYEDGDGDAQLEGFFDVLKDVVTAPVKAGAAVVKTAVRAAPGAITGFIAGGPAGAVVGGVTSLVTRGGRVTTPAVGAPTVAVAGPGFTPVNSAGLPILIGSMPQNDLSAGGINIGDILKRAAEAAIRAAKNEAIEQGAPYIEPVIQPIVEERVIDELQRRALSTAQASLPLLLGVGILGAVLLGGRRRRR